MAKFKAGDKAVLMSVEPYWGVEVGAEVKIKGPFEGSAGPGYWVELCNEPGSCIYYAERRLGPVDDPLPPAPESVRYNDEYPIPNIYERTWLDVRRDPHHIYLESGQYGTTHGVGMVLGPDAALQLAHDLTRMAMEIKRKEKQGG